MDKAVSGETAGAELLEIVELVQQGDVQAYTQVIRHFQRPIYLYCHYLLGSPQEAEDAVQDIFIKGLENIGGLARKVSFSAWLYRIARNHCLDLLKKRSKSSRFLALYQKHQQQAVIAATGLGYTEPVIRQHTGMTCTLDKEYIPEFEVTLTLK